MMIDTVLLILNYLFALTMPFSHIGGYAASGLCVFFIWRYWKGIRKEPIAQILVLFLIYGTVRTILSSDTAAGYGAMTGYLTHWLFPFMLGYSLPSSLPSSLPENISLRRVFWAYALTLGAVVAAALCSYCGLLRPELMVLGNHLFLIEDGLLKALRSHIALAALSLLFSCSALGLLLYETNAPAWKRALYGTMMLFFLVAVLLSGSRGYYIAAAGVYSAFIVLWCVTGRKWLTLGVSVILAACIVCLILAFSPALKERLRHTGFQDNNVSERLSLYKVAWWEIQSSPFFGYGPGQGIKQTSFFEKLPEVQRSVQRHPHLHSFYLNTGADFGLAGLGLFFLIIAWWARTALAVFLSSEGFLKAFAFGILLGGGGILLGELFDTLLRGPGVAMEFFWLAGLLAGARQHIRNNVTKGEDIR